MNPTALADDELAQGVVAGDEECLAAAYDRWSALVRSTAHRCLGDAKEAEDVTQLVFLGVWRSRHRYHPHLGTFPGWIMGITRHRIADALT
ncbi:MAG TPA: sigma factor, partial [Streptomyces sp.]